MVLGLCVGAVVADVLFGPEQPATSSSGSNGDQWDPWRRWWRRGREGLHAFGQWLHRSGERGWASVSRTFPDRRHGGARNPEVVPPPVAPPLHPERTPAPRPVAFEAPPTDEVLRGTMGPLSSTIPLPAPEPPPTAPDPRWEREPVPTGSTVPTAPAGNGDARHRPIDDEATRPAWAGAGSFPGDNGNGDGRLGDPGGNGGAGTMTALRQRLSAPVAPPVAITIPRRVRVRAGVGLLIFTLVIGLGSAMALLGVIFVAIRALGGV